MAGNADTIKNRLKALRERMSGGEATSAPADLCLITSDDFHGSEYTGDHFKVREFFSGFTGSAGTLVISIDNAWLFTDGRYFVQAQNELEGTGIHLMKSGTEGVPSVEDFLKEKALHIRRVKNSPAVLICDGRTVSARLGDELASDDNITFFGDFDPAEDIWTDRPPVEASDIFILDDNCYAGENVESKLSRIRGKMKDEGCDRHVVAALDDIAWTLNLRASDIECTPVFTAYLWIDTDEALLFTDLSRVSEKVTAFLEGYGVKVRDYEDFYDFLREGICSVDVAQTGAGSHLQSETHKNEKKGLLYDKKNVNYNIFEIIRNAPRDPGREGENPAKYFKAVKNPVEIKNLTEVHIDDGLCVFRLMRYVKEAVKAGDTVTELSAVRYIDRLRSEVPDFKELSFPTISAFGANAAMMHYSATEESDTEIRPGGMLLVDSGGQYLRGTTDVTRTFALGKADDEMKKAYTLTVKGAFALSDAVFLEGCSGYSLDILARQPLWREHIDYRCGTGHGVGYMLGVHEGPNSFRWKYLPGISEIAELKPGMVTTDEPGVYVDGSYGIRFENELLCEKDTQNEYGTFLRFRILTVAPLDPELIDTKWLDRSDLERINRYNRFVYETLAPRLEAEELEYLKDYTKEIKISGDDPGL